VTRHSRGNNTRYLVNLDVDNQLRNFEVTRTTYLSLKRGQPVPFRDCGSWSTVGLQPTAHFGASMAAALLVLFAGFHYARRRKLTRPWYEGPLVQAGKGRLTNVASGAISHFTALALIGLMSVAATACGPSSRKGDGRVPIGLESNEESPGDAVSSPNTPPGSPGVTPTKFGPR